MRARSVRLSILIIVILGLALAALGFRAVNIDIPGFPALERGGTGPLGLKLGLDLRGGGHLVYQADTGTRVDVVFTAVDPEAEAETEAENLEDASTTTDAAGDPDAETASETAGDSAGPVDTEQPAGKESGEDTPIDAPEEQPAQDTPEPQGEGEPQSGPGPRLITTEQVTSTLNEVLLAEFTVVQRSVNNFRINTGLIDDQGEQELREALAGDFGSLLSFQVTKIEEPTSEQMEGVLDIINRRVNRFGTEEPIIQQFGDDRIIVQLPGATGSITRITFNEPLPEDKSVADIEAIMSQLGVENFNVLQMTDLDFQIRSDTLSTGARQGLSQVIEDQIASVDLFTVSSGIDDAKALIGQTARLEFKERTCADPGCFNFTDAEIGLSGDDLSRADVSADNSGIGWAINIQFDGHGSDVFSDLTQRLFQRQDTGRIAIFLDDEELLAPVARAWIRDGRSQITGNFAREEARTIAIQLESGRLPVPLKLIQESDVDALLGSESLRNSLLAGLIGLGIVMVFMMVYYRMAGLVASLALIFYTVVLLAFFKLIPITLTLSHIGGFILSIGMAVDANILIFERMKEEIRIGRTLASSMEVGFNRAWPAIRDSNVSTMITCLVLLWFGDRLGGGLVTGFAISLFLGVAVSMFTALTVSRNLLQLMAWIGLAHRIQLFTPEKIQRTAQGAAPGTVPVAGGGS
ncbi:MAG: protein-export membrane protein SecD [SAR202 cluster bacterium Io17-Chloro-G9]|nr:MAG: protein-export membrane protein SecD [SAR202 cluster bacterium Io17-Chloro-G9]